MKADLFDKKGKKLDGSVTLNEAVWSEHFNEDLVAQVIYVYRSNQRQGSATAQTRAEVSGGGRKPWKQKGTGRARHGSIRSPIWVGGGVTFPPSKRNWQRSINKKMSRKALCVALSKRIKDNQIRFFDMDDGMARKVFSDLKKFLIVTDNEKVFKKFRNVEGASIVPSSNLNTYNVVAHENIVFDSNSLKAFEGRMVKDGK